MLSQLIAAVAALTTSTAELAETNKLLTSDNKKLRNELDGVPTSRSGRSSSLGKTFTKANPGRSAVGAYCHTHGFRLGKTHTSSTCSNTRPTHNKEATAPTPWADARTISAGTPDSVG